jgi:TetR/AcrR family transcriptional regulator
MMRGRKRTENPATARRILAAAEERFAAQGMAGARTDEIAAAAHANKAMLYYYFGNKRRLHQAVLENLFRQLRTTYVLPKKHASPREKLRAFIVGYFDFLATHPNYPRLVMREAMERTRNFDRIVRQYLRPFYAQLARTIEEGVAGGSLRDVDKHHAAFSIVGMITSYFAAAPILGQVVGYSLLTPSAIEERKRAVLDFIDHGLIVAKERSR